MFWWASRFFAPDDGDGVDAKDLCPGPNQFCLDDLEFVIVSVTRYLRSTLLAIFPVP